jgi:hypothetical protein
MYKIHYFHSVLSHYYTIDMYKSLPIATRILYFVLGYTL